MIEPLNSLIPVYRQCELIGLPRSSYYYEARKESEYNLLLMRLIDEEYSRTPFYGTRRMTAYLIRQGYEVNRKRIQRLMKLMGIEAIYPKKRLSISSPEDKKYPYLLKDVAIIEPDQVWSADITYIRMNKGFLYLVAIIDWYSRYALSWELSNTLDADFCLRALDKALLISQPEIFNSDQGSQFTSSEFTEKLDKVGIQSTLDSQKSMREAMAEKPKDFEKNNTLESNLSTECPDASDLAVRISRNIHCFWYKKRGKN